MKKENNFWIDDNSNKWNCNDWAEEQAKAASATLDNCTLCTDCVHCINCKVCTSCRVCTDCQVCTNCEHCYGCVHCVDSSNLDNKGGSIPIAFAKDIHNTQE